MQRLRPATLADGGGCRPCPARLLGAVRCDTYVLAPNHCVTGNYYPVAAPDGDPDGAPRLVRWSRDLLRADYLPCRRPGQCNAGWKECLARTPVEGRHTNAAERELPYGRPVNFQCGPTVKRANDD